MILIIGGAYQGKTEYAKENFPELEKVVNFEKIIYDLVKENKDSYQWTLDNLENFQNKVVICEDISCGLVPMDAVNRKWREELGRSLALISKNSTKVVKVFCGLGLNLK